MKKKKTTYWIFTSELLFMMPGKDIPDIMLYCIAVEGIALGIGPHILTRQF
jgi:hypothetical protein